MSDTTPLLVSEDRLSQERVKVVQAAEEQDSFQYSCQFQAWRPSLSKVSSIVTYATIFFFSSMFFVLGF